MLHQLASTQLAGRSDKVPNMLPNGPSQMNEILRCLFLFSHFFLSSSFLFAPPLLPLPLARSRFTPLSLALTNLTLVELFPVFSRSLSPTHYLRARTSSPPFPLGLIHTDQGCKCDVVYHCAVPSHWGGGILRTSLAEGDRKDLYLLFMVCFSLSIIFGATHSIHRLCSDGQRD